RGRLGVVGRARSLRRNTSPLTGRFTSRRGDPTQGNRLLGRCTIPDPSATAPRGSDPPRVGATCSAIPRALTPKRGLTESVSLESVHHPPGGVPRGRAADWKQRLRTWRKTVSSATKRIS